VTFAVSGSRTIDASDRCECQSQRTGVERQTREAFASGTNTVKSCPAIVAD